MVAAGQQPRITVGKNVQVSADNSKLAHGEILMAADPKDPRHLVGCSMIFPDPFARRISDGVNYTSTDGGLSWKQSLYVNKGDYGSGDPACTYGPGGTAFTAYLGPGLRPGMEDVLFYRSSDGGQTWQSMGYINRALDREYVTVDTTGGKYNGHIYINGTGAFRPVLPTGDPEEDSVGITIQRSTDGGATFRTPLNRLSKKPNYVLGMGNGAVLSDGTYVAIFGDLTEEKRAAEVHPTTPNAFLKVISSTDGGETFGDASVVSDWYMNYGEIGSTSSIVPTITVDRSSGPFRDRLYASWPDYRSGRGEVFLSHSTDKGKTWSSPIIVNDDRAWAPPKHGPDDILPVVDVNKDGIVGVSWYDRRDNPNNYGWWIRFAASTDGGETFGPSVRVSEAPQTIASGPKVGLDGFSSGGGQPSALTKTGEIHVNLGFGGVFGFNGGHTAGMAADAGGQFHPFWIDNRTGVEQIWTAAVTVEGASVVKNGSQELAGMDDVTNMVTVDFKDGKFDRNTGVLSIDAYLGNTSDKPLKGPIRMRVLTVSSKIGAPAIQNSDNNLPGAGAVFDFTEAIPDQSKGLEPGQIAKAKRITVKLAGFGDHNPPTTEELGQFLMIDARVFGPSGSKAAGK